MSNVCCAMCNVVVKAPNDLLTRRPNPQWENDFVILSLGQWVLGQVHWTSQNRHSTFDNCGSTPGEPLTRRFAPPNSFTPSYPPSGPAGRVRAAAGPTVRSKS